MRRIGSIAVLSALVGVLAGPGTASAQASNQACGMQLLAIEEARLSLEPLQETVRHAKADRAALEKRLVALAIELAATVGDAERRRSLTQERERVKAEIGQIDELLPPIERQAVELAHDVEAAERAYIACIEGSL